MTHSWSCIIEPLAPFIPHRVSTIQHEETRELELWRTFCAMGASPKHFQKRRVSSAAADTTVQPSGDWAMCSTRAVWPCRPQAPCQPLLDVFFVAELSPELITFVWRFRACTSSTTRNKAPEGMHGCHATARESRVGTVLI